MKYRSYLFGSNDESAFQCGGEGGRGFAMCARRYASGAAESAAISARAAATSSLLVWA
jgi:hypothetical protein